MKIIPWKEGILDYYILAIIVHIIPAKDATDPAVRPAPEGIPNSHLSVSGENKRLSLLLRRPFFSVTVGNPAGTSRFILAV